jgi:hypothetical protein
MPGFLSGNGPNRGYTRQAAIRPNKANRTEKMIAASLASILTTISPVPGVGFGTSPTAGGLSNECTIAAFIVSFYYSGSGVVSRCLGVDNKETNGEFWRSRTACSLESSSNLITCRGDHRVRMIYHSLSLSLTAAVSLAVANLDRSRSAKSRDQPWFLPENEGDPSMQIHPTRIDIFVIHKILQRRDNHLPAG